MKDKGENRDYGLMNDGTDGDLITTSEMKWLEELFPILILLHKSVVVSDVPIPALPIILLDRFSTLRGGRSRQIWIDAATTGMQKDMKLLRGSTLSLHICLLFGMT